MNSSGVYMKVGLFKKAAMLACLSFAGYVYMEPDRAEVETPSSADFLDYPMSDGVYGWFLTRLRAAVAADFPEQAPRIIIADRRQPLLASINSAARQWNLDGDGVYTDFMKRQFRIHGFLTLSGVGGLAIPYHDAKGDYYCLVLGLDPREEKTALALIKRNFHELFHCLDDHVTDVRYKLGENPTAAQLVLHKGNEVYAESFAEIAAVSALVENGYQRRDEIAAYAVDYGWRLAGSAKGAYSPYQPGEGLRQLDDLLGAKPYAAYDNGQPLRLKQAFALARTAQAKAGYSIADGVARATVGGAYSTVLVEQFGGNYSRFERWLTEHGGLQEVARSTVSQDFQISKDRAAWLRRTPGKLDHARNMAHLFMYKHQAPNDKALATLIEAYRATISDLAQATPVQPVALPDMNAAMFGRMERDPAFARRYALGGALPK